jgi:tetratricopeptide (TPR) repeat protein
MNRPWLLVVVVLVCSLLCLGCDELSARSNVQRGNAAYGDQEFEKAVARYETALGLAPQLDVIHHNLGIAYSRLFHPGIETPANKAIADKATSNLSHWLEKHPHDAPVRNLLTGLWLDSGNYEAAIAFWKKEYEQTPTARDVIQKIAGIYLKSGDWRSAIDWYRKDIDQAPDVPAKVAAYQSIANVAFSKIWTMASREKVIGLERTEIAEIGLEAAGKGLELDPSNLQLTSIVQGLWLNRGTAQGPIWAGAIDRSMAQIYGDRARVLREQAKKNQPAPEKAATPGGTGTGS